MIFGSEKQKNYWEIRTEQLADIVEGEITNISNAIEMAVDLGETSVPIQRACTPETVELIERLFAEKHDFLIHRLRALLRKTVKCNLERDAQGVWMLSWNDSTLFAPEKNPTSGDGT